MVPEVKDHGMAGEMAVVQITPLFSVPTPNSLGPTIFRMGAALQICLYTALATLMYASASHDGVFDRRNEEGVSVPIQPITGRAPWIVGATWLREKRHWLSSLGRIGYRIGSNPMARELEPIRIGSPNASSDDSISYNVTISNITRPGEGAISITKVAEIYAE